MLTLQFMPYSEFEQLSSEKRIEKLLKIVKENKILLMEGRLRRDEEAEMIKVTMEQIDENFKGIEIGTIFPNEKKHGAFFKKIKANFINILLGDRKGFTIIGPASIVEQIKQDPNKIQLFTKDINMQRVI